MTAAPKGAKGLRHAMFAGLLTICALSASPETLPSDVHHTHGSEAGPDQLFMSPAWRDLVTMLREKALNPVDEDSMRRACQQAQALSSSAESPADACLAAALERAEPRAIYYSREKTVERRDDATPAQVGIGLEVGAMRQPGDDLLIVSPIAGSPAERAGVFPGDRIARIDGQDVRPVTTHQAMMKLRGDPGSEVSLELARGADREKILLVIRRARIRVKAVGREPAQGGVVALRISRFDHGTAAELSECVHQILHAMPSLPTTLLVDLRANPGGGLDFVRQVAGLLSGSTDAVVAKVVDRAGSRQLNADTVELSESNLSLPERDWLARVQVGVLVDRGTGSGAELLAQFLRESRNARIFGSRTFGMAYIVDTIPLNSGASVLLPVGDLLSPRGSSWQGGGIAPDVEVAATPRAEFGSERDAQFYDAMRDLQGR